MTPLKKLDVSSSDLAMTIATESGSADGDVADGACGERKLCERDVGAAISIRTAAADALRMESFMEPKVYQVRKSWRRLWSDAPKLMFLSDLCKY